MMPGKVCQIVQPADARNGELRRIEDQMDKLSCEPSFSLDTSTIDSQSHVADAFVKGRWLRKHVRYARRV